MEIYLDIVYLINVYVGMLCWISMELIQNYKVPFKKLLALSLSWGLLALGLYFPYRYSFFLGWSCLHIYLYQPKHRLKNMMIWIFLYFTYTMSFFSFSQAIYRKGPIIFVGLSFHWLPMLLLGTMVLLLYLVMVFQLRKEVVKKGLMYQVLIRKEAKTWECRGFLDTGNQALLDGLPVLFSATLPVTQERSLLVSQVFGQRAYEAMRVEIYWNETWKEAYLAKMEDLKLKEADVLLNLSLF